jgi:glycine/D-amino acid oxidase-like deaminating enzyme
MRIIIGKATSLDKANKAITVNNEEISYGKLLVTCGPWSGRVGKELGINNIPVSELPGHSIHIKPAPGWPDSLEGQSIFAGVEDSIDDTVDAIAWHGGEGWKGKCTPSIELCSRKGYVYVAGENGTPSKSKDLPGG